MSARSPAPGRQAQPSSAPSWPPTTPPPPSDSSSPPSGLRRDFPAAAGPLTPSFRRNAMIFGAHVILYSGDADADRAFLSEILGVAGTDAGDGWLIFPLRPAEAAGH